MSKANFRFSTDILRRLGEELNPSLEHGILELAKNAYDADATEFVVTLNGTDKIGGTLSVTDNGTGMTADDIRNGWLVIGQSQKAKIKKTKGGRIPAGYKGLGRLAALRLGQKVSVVTTPRSTRGTRYSLAVDWDAFDHANLVEDVQLDIKTLSPELKPTFGTVIQVENLRSSVSRAELRRLARELILLADPFEDLPNSFKPILVAPDYEEIAKLIRSRYLVDADYHLDAKLDSKGHASATVRDWKGKVLFKATHTQIAAERLGKPYRCPAAQFDFWSFILRKESFLERTAKLQDVRTWLETVGGVHFYQNQLRVSPYGNPGNDWLDINLRRSQSPEERPSTNNSIGRVVVHDENFQLVQKTDRSGFIETGPFQELRDFANDALEWMARERINVANKRRQKERVAAPQQATRVKERLEQAISSTPRGSQKAIRQALTAYEAQNERVVDTLRKEVQLYRTLSTAGITAATFAHESSGNPLKIIHQAINTIERRGQQHLTSKYESLLGKPVSMIVRSIGTLGVLSQATLSLIDHDKRRATRVDFNRTVKQTVETFSPFLAGRDILVDLELSGGTPLVRGSEAAIESLVANLLNNSVSAFESAGTSKRQLRIETITYADDIMFTVSDNGPGITGISEKDIWSPGITTRPHGTGLGLTIVRDTVTDLGGSVAAKKKGELGGASIIIRLPLTSR
jgi:signal transduction histidine kinase